MLNITKFALRRPITLVLALVTIFFFGFQSVLSAKQELMPEMIFPMLIVSTYITDQDLRMLQSL